MRITVGIDEFDKNKGIIVSALGIFSAFVVEGFGPEYEIRIGRGGEVIATASVVEGKPVFETKSTSNGQQFAALMIRQYPKSDPERLLWLVVFPWYDGQWSYFGSPTESKEEAVEGLDVQMVKNDGARLVAFKASEWPCLVLKYDKSFVVQGQLPSVIVDSEDMGEGLVSFTNLEAMFR